jgi:transcriptional regulator GlxA family with amidase domain
VLLSRRDGSRDWFSITKLPLVDDSGLIAGLCGVMRLLNQSAAPEITSAPWARVIDVILTGYREPLPISALAARASLSVSQFNRQFRKRFDTTPHRYLASVRVNAACHLLISTDLSIAEIALRTGFCDQSHLTNQFVRFRGVTPAKYRARYCKTVSLAPSLLPPPLRSAS